MILTCITTVIFNRTDIPYTDQDLKAIMRSQKVCKERYNGCVNDFQKREQGVYRVTCGNKRLFNKKALDMAERGDILEELKHLSKEDRDRKLEAIGIKGE